MKERNVLTRLPRPWASLKDEFKIVSANAVRKYYSGLGVCYRDKNSLKLHNTTYYQLSADLPVKKYAEIDQTLTAG
ncbi:MAG: hypothetical protein FVQ81_00900 [Candidatus Glassbacteria bacterium]|nr:hypothetical protein [Candidatus Glassbacteria bacterium]